MKAIILAAGEGTRLRPLTNKTPKCLVRILDRSILERQICLFKNNNINDIYVVGGYLSELLDNKPDYKLLINKKYKTTNMVYSLMCAKDQLSDDVIVSYGDILFAEDLLKKIIFTRENIAIAIDMNWKNYWGKRFSNPLEDLESLKLNNKDEILNIGNSVNSYTDIDGQFMGLIRLNKKGSNKIISSYDNALKEGRINNKNLNNSFMTDILQEIIDTGYKVKAIKNNLPWVEIDSINDYENKENINRIRFLDSKFKSIYKIHN